MFYLLSIILSILGGATIVFGQAGSSRGQKNTHHGQRYRKCRASGYYRWEHGEMKMEDRERRMEPGEMKEHPEM